MAPASISVSDTAAYIATDLALGGSSELLANNADITAITTDGCGGVYVADLATGAIWRSIDGPFEPLSPSELLGEQRGLLEALEGLVPPTGSRGTIFRSDHASNYLPLTGNLPRDRGRLLDELSAAQRGEVRLRPEWARGL